MKRFPYLYLALALIATAPVLMIWGVSGSANFFYGRSLGTDDPFTFIVWTLTTADIFAYASLSSDVLKAVICVLIVLAIQMRAWAGALVMMLIAACAFAWSGQSALGFSSLNFTEVYDGRTKGAATWDLLTAEIERVEQRRAWIPDHRPVSTVQAAVNAAENDRLFSDQRTKGCTDATVPESITFCSDHAALKRELENAKAANELDGRLAELRDELRQTQAVSEADPQATMVAMLLGVKVTHDIVQKMLTGRSVGFAVLLELIAGLGLFAVWSPLLKARRRNRTEAAEAAAQDRDRQPSETASTLLSRTSPDAADPAPSREVAVAGGERPYGDVTKFFREHTVPDLGAEHSATEMYERYCDVCEEEEREPVAITMFGRKAGEFVTKGTGRRVSYLGRALLGSGGARRFAA